MDQRNREFVPHVLVIEAGTWVDFPNNDTVSHQVYSFSPAKPFQLPLYKGRTHPPVLFDRAGVVTLGCNIHDNMLGYIYVADSPCFGKTDLDGRWSSGELPAGRYDVRIWSPRIKDRTRACITCSTCGVASTDGDIPPRAQAQVRTQTADGCQAMGRLLGMICNAWAACARAACVLAALALWRSRPGLRRTPTGLR